MSVRHGRGRGARTFPLKNLDLNYDRTFNDQGWPALKGMTADQAVLARHFRHETWPSESRPELTNLTELDLADIGITDRAFSALAGLTKLRRLNLQAARHRRGT